MKIEFCKLENKDIPDVVDLMAQLGYEHTLDSLTVNINSVRNNRGEIFVALLEGEVCGCISAILDVRLAEGAQGELVSLVVQTKVRGKGIGSGLVKTAEQWLFKHTPVIRVRANQTRSDAHKFYMHLGYTVSKTQLVFRKNV